MRREEGKLRTKKDGTSKGRGKRLQQSTDWRGQHKKGSKGYKLQKRGRVDRWGRRSSTTEYVVSRQSSQAISKCERNYPKY